MVSSTCPDKIAGNFAASGQLLYATNNAFAWGCGGVVVSRLDLRSDAQWFEVHSLPSCCFP